MPTPRYVADVLHVGRTWAGVVLPLWRVAFAHAGPDIQRLRDRFAVVRADWTDRRESVGAMGREASAVAKTERHEARGVRGAVEGMSDCRNITFQGGPFILIDGPDAITGPIATPEAYAAGEPSFAHMYADGRIMRFGRQIGTRDVDVVFGDAREVEIEDPITFLCNLFSDDWLGGHL